MTLYNVAVPVVELVEAGSKRDALALLMARLERAGFEVYDGPLTDGPHAFESEGQTT